MQIAVKRAISVTISECADGLEFLTGIAGELSSYLHDFGERSLVDFKLTGVLSELRGQRLCGHPLLRASSDTMYSAASDTMRRYVLGAANATVVRGVRTIVPKCSLRQLMTQVLVGYWQSLHANQWTANDARGEQQTHRDSSHPKYFVPTPDGTYEVLVTRSG